MENNTLKGANTVLSKFSKFFYIIDLIKSRRKLSPGTIVLLVLNLIIPIAVCIAVSGGWSTAGGWILNISLVIIVSIIGVVLGLTPLGEAVTAFLARSKKPNDEISALALPVFNSVYKRALEQDPSLSKNIELRIIKSKSVKVYAVGRHTIIMSKGAAFLPEEDLEKEFIREFAYISNKDVDIVTFALAGNIIISFTLLLYRIMIQAVFIIFTIGEFFTSKGSLLASLLSLLANVIFTVLFGWIILLFNNIAMLLVKKDLEKSAAYVSEFSDKCGCPAAI